MLHIQVVVDRYGVKGNINFTDEFNPSSLSEHRKLCRMVSAPHQ